MTQFVMTVRVVRASYRSYRGAGGVLAGSTGGVDKYGTATGRYCMRTRPRRYRSIRRSGKYPTGRIANLFKRVSQLSIYIVTQIHNKVSATHRHSPCLIRDRLIARPVDHT